MRTALLLALLFAALPCVAQQQPDIEGAKRTIAAIDELLKSRPNDANLYFYLARFKADVGDKAGSVAALEKVGELGEGYLPTKEFGFAAIWDHAPFQAARAKLEAKLPRLDYAPAAFTLRDRTIIPEGIAHDPHSGRFYVGSIAQRKVLQIEPDGTATELAGLDAKLDEILGLALDAPRRRLYAVSTSALTTKGEKNRRNSVVSFDIETRKMLRRYDVPGAQQLNDVAIAPGGRVFASDSGSGAIYEIMTKGPGADSRELVPTGRIRGTNGLAVSADAKRIYVAHSTGLAVVEVESGEVKRVENTLKAPGFV